MSTSPLAQSIYGSFYFGTILATAFYGVTCMQTFFYYLHYQNDPLRIKILVAAMWALNTIYEALLVSGVYKYIMAGMTNSTPFTTGNPELALLYLAMTLVAVPTQGFFVHRIYIFGGKNIIIPLIWLPVALAESVSTIVYTSKALYVSNGLHVVGFGALSSGIFATLGTLAFSLIAGVDIVIAILMTLLLVRQRTNTNLEGTLRVLQRLIVFAVNTGTWTALSALLTIIMLHLFPPYYLVFVLPICSAYCNTLLANLNARAYVRGTEGGTHNLMFTNASLRPPENGEGDSVLYAHQGIDKATMLMTVPNVGRSTTKQGVTQGF